MIRCFVSFFFGIAAILIAIAAAGKWADNPVWLILGLVALGLGLALFYNIYSALRFRQTVKVTPSSITAESPAKGTTRLAWRDITNIREVQSRVDKARSAAPLVEVMISLYFNLPFLADIQRRGLLVFEAGHAPAIAIRQHLVYPHRLDQLKQAIEQYAPARTQGEQYLKLNLNN